MIGILGGMGTHAGIDFCNKLAMLNQGKVDQKQPLFILFNKSNVPARTENLKNYNKVLKSLLKGCQLLKKNNCKFIAMPCNTAHHWYNDLQKKIKVPIINMPNEVFNYCKKNMKKNSKIGILATQGTLKTKIYDQFFDKNFILLSSAKAAWAEDGSPNRPNGCAYTKDGGDFWGPEADLVPVPRFLPKRSLPQLLSILET